MPKIEIYTSMFCGYCHHAKRLLKHKGVDYAEVDVLLHPSRRGEMAQRAGGLTSVPQIFIDGEHIGGCDELYALEQDGLLDEKLGLVG